MKLNTKMNKSEIKDLLKEQRETLSEASLNTYGSLISTLVKRLGNIDLDNTKMITTYLSNPESRISLNAKKTILSGLYILSKKQDYKDAMMENIKEFNDIQKTQTMTEREKENWIDFKEIAKIYKDNKKRYWEMLKKDKLNDKEKQDVMKFIIFLFCSGVLFPPRRSQDWVSLKWKNDGSKDTNYIEKSQFIVFQNYKTEKTYNSQKIDIGREASKWLKAWHKHQDSAYVFTTNKNIPLSSNILGQKLNSFFDGKHISTSMLRKIYLSEKYKDIPKLAEMEKTAKQMGHSLDEALKSYVKKNNDKDEMETKEEKKT